ncbi:hypothetical protein ACWDE9_10970 [Streptomyces olivaceoviridis]
MQVNSSLTCTDTLTPLLHHAVTDSGRTLDEPSVRDTPRADVQDAIGDGRAGRV